MQLEPGTVVFEAYDVRIVYSEVTVMSEEAATETTKPALVVERQSRNEDATGQKVWLPVDLGNTVWVIQAMAKALFEREMENEIESGDTPELVFLGPNRYTPTPPVII